jgi:hypothetical protein
LKNRWRSDEPRSARSGSSASGPQARGKYRLEPLEPRVLLSSDLLGIAVTAQTLQDPQADDGGITPIVEQLDAGTDARSSVTTNDGEAAASTPSDVSVAWPEGWQASAADNAVDDPVAAPAGDTETLTQASATPDSSDTQAAQFLQAVMAIASQQNASSGTENSGAGGRGAENTKK